MRVLWLSNTAVGASEYLKIKFDSGGWMSSLETYIKTVEGIDLAVCFFNNGNNPFKFSFNSVTYYPIKDKFSTIVSKITLKLFNKLYDSNLPDLLKVINDFKPDIIQLFGTESGLGEIVTKTKIPVIIHIQGIINPCASAWLPKGISLNKILINSNLTDLLRKLDWYSKYKLYTKIATREELIIRNAKYFFGRTEWDKRIIHIYNANIEYFHCNELLRPIFYENKWCWKNESELKLVSTINPQIYKGLEIILETAVLLKKTKLKFEWNIIGINDDNDLVKLIEKIFKKRFQDNNVFFKGPKYGQSMISELLNSHIFIHPSHIDNSPNSVCEAMLLGMPVIAGSVGGVPSIIENNDTGILYNSYDSHELTGIILEKAYKKEELQKLGTNARELALIRHDPRKIIPTIIDTYNYILQSNS